MEGLKMKLYKTQKEAEKVLALLKKSNPNKVVEPYANQFRIVEAKGTVKNKASAKSTTAKSASTKDAKPVKNESKTDIVCSVKFIGARITEQSIITAPMGDGPNGPVERWFVRSRVKDLKKHSDGVSFTANMSVFTSRKIDPTQYAYTPN